MADDQCKSSPASGLQRFIDRAVRGEGLRAQLVRGGLGSVALKGANAVLQLAITALLARSLGVSEFGTYAFVLATISLLAIPADAGVPTLIVRLTATYRARAEWALLSGLWRRSRQLLLAVSTAVVTLAVLFFWLLGDRADTDWNRLAPTLAAALFIVPLKSLAEGRSAALRGLGRVVLGQVAEQLVKPLVLALLVGVCLLVPAITLSAPLAMTLHAAAALASMIVATLALARACPVEAISTAPEYRDREWLRTVVPLSLLAGAQVVLQQTGSVMLGAMSGVDAVAHYRIAIQSAAVVSFGLLTATTVMSPHLARLYATGELRLAQAMITASARVVCLAALTLTLLFVAFGSWFIGVFFGGEYSTAYLPLVTISAGLLLKAAAGPAAAVLTMTGHERDAFRGVAVATVANVAFNVFLIPRFGALGAAAASALSFAVWGVQLTWLAYRRTGFDTTVFGIWRKAADPPA